MSERDAAETEVTHGIQGAYYSGGPGEPYYRPVMECTCGFTTVRHTDWEHAGQEFDTHLLEVRIR
jgi:hypothetical protein